MGSAILPAKLPETTKKLYTNIHFLTGKQQDGVPVDVYSSNYIWDAGINLGWAFGKR